MAAVALPSLPLDVQGGPGVTIKREGGRLTISVDVETAVDAHLAELPTASTGLGPDKLWRNGNSAEGYVISQTGTNG